MMPGLIDAHWHSFVLCLAPAIRTVYRRHRPYLHCRERRGETDVDALVVIMAPDG